MSTSSLSADARTRLSAFKREVEARLPGQVVEMRLFGSRARGDAGTDSDYDIAVFLRSNADGLTPRKVLSDAAYPHILDGFFFRAIIVPADFLNGVNGYRPELAEEIARDGIVVS